MAKLSKEERIELGYEAMETLQQKAFLIAVAQMKKACHQDIIQNMAGTLTSRAACVKLQVLDGFLTELMSLYNDAKVAEKEKG